MALNWPVFFTRLGSAIIFAILMMTGLLWNTYAFLTLTALIQFLCLRDYFRLAEKIAPDAPRPAGTILVVQLTGLLALISIALPYAGITEKALWPLLLCIPAFLLLLTALSKKAAWQAGIQALGALLYITLPMLLFVCLRFQSLALPLALILMIWMNDTMAYLVGSFIGKTPFFPGISPKKTWEGTLGGALLTVAGAAVWGCYAPMYRMQDWIALAICAAVAGTAGDLLESRLKRLAGVKDSGTLMPGHGGALDRFDSLLVAVPFAFCYAYWFLEPYLVTIF